jgi:hypothetical protein
LGQGRGVRRQGQQDGVQTNNQKSHDGTGTKGTVKINR